jgi:hypothetical protein
MMPPTKMEMLEVIILILAAENDLITLTDEDKQLIARALRGHALK